MLLNVKNDIREIGKICDSIREFCALNNVSDTKCYDISIIVDELATNVINYAYDDGNQHEFLIKFEMEGEIVHVEIIDDGKPFDPLKKADPNLDKSLEERQIGGLGIFFAKQLAERMSYKRSNGKNQLSIFVNVKEEG